MESSVIRAYLLMIAARFLGYIVEMVDDIFGSDCTLINLDHVKAFERIIRCHLMAAEFSLSII